MALNTSNTAFVTILEPLPLEAIGWEVVVRSNTDYATVLAIIGHYANMTMSVELSGLGGGSVTLDKGHPVFSAPTPTGASILDEENLWELYEDGVLRQQFFARDVTEGLLDESQRVVLTVSGPGAGRALQWAKVMPPGYGHVPNDGFGFAYPNYSNPSDAIGYIPPFFYTYGDDGPKYPWKTWWSVWAWGTAPAYDDAPFGFAPRMATWLAIFQECRARASVDVNPGPIVTPVFTNLADTTGQQWADSVYEQIDVIGLSMLDLLTQFAEIIGAEWVMRPGFQLDVRQAFGDHRESEVVLYPLTDQKSVSRIRQREEIANVVVAKDRFHNISTAKDNDSIAKWGRREVYIEAGNATDDTSRQAIADAYLRRYKDEVQSWTIAVAASQQGSGRRVFVDYNVGDWIAIVVTDDNAVTNTTETFRVQAISLSVNENGTETLELTLESKAAFTLRKMQQATEKLGGATGTSIAPTPITGTAAVGGAVLGDLADTNIDYTTIVNNSTLIYNSVTQVFEVGAPPSSVSLQTGPPADPIVGQVWIDSDSVGAQGGGDGMDASWNPYGAPVWADEFRDGIMHADWTRADNATYVNNVVWTEGADSMSVWHKSIADPGTQFHCMLVPIDTRGGAFVPGDAIVTSARFLGSYATNYTMWGICLTDGVTFGTSNLVMTQVYSNSSNAGPGVLRINTQTGMQTEGVSAVSTQMNPTNGPLFLRLVMTATNTWRCDASPDGVSWWIGNATATYALTPSHMGFAISNWGTTMQSVVSYDFLRRYSGVV